MRRTIYKFLFSLIFLMGVTSAWADDLTLFTTNFSTADGWTTESIITSSTTEATRTIKGTVISFKGYKTSDLTVAVGATADADGTLTFTGSNISASAGDASKANYYMAIPVSGVNGELTVTTTGDATKWYYSYDDVNVGTIVARTQATDNGGFTITGLTKSNVTIYIGSNAKKLNSITITTPKPIKSQTVTGVKIGGTKVEGASFDATNTYVSAQGAPAAPKASIIKHIVYADDSEEDVDVDVTLAKNGEFFVGSATINEVVYTIKVPVTASNACHLTSILFSNSVYGAIADPIAESGTPGEEGYTAAANGKVTVCYMAGTDAPTITDSSIKVSEAASYDLKGNTITVTAEDRTSTKLYEIAYTAITPLEVNSDIEKTTFTEVPSWVSAPYGWDATKGVKFAKAVDDANNMRIAKGFTRQYYFVGPAKSLTLTSMDAARAINVYVNGTKVDGITTTEKKGDITITLSETENNMVCIESNQTGGDGGFTDYAVVAAEQQAGPQPAEWESYELVLNKEGLLTADEIANKNETTFGIALDEEGNAIRVDADATDAIAVITGKYHSDHGMSPFSMKAKVPGAVKITAGTCSYGTCTVTVNGTAAGETVVGDNVNKTTCWKNNKDNVATGIYNGEAGEITITTGCYTPYIKIEKYVAPEPEPQPTEWESYELVLNKEGLLTAEEIANKNETTFGIALDEEGNAIRVDADAADAIAVITGKYHSDHGMNPFSMKAKVPGAVKITAGTCSYGTCTVTVNGTAAGETVVGDNVNKTTCWKNNKDNVATGIYNGEAGEITITTGCYTPYIKIEKFDAGIHNVTFAKGDVECEGTQLPEAKEVAAGEKITIPANYTLYKEGYTLTGWTDGTNTYNVGTSFAPTAETTLTPVFTQNTKNLADRTEPVTVKWNFRRDQGAPVVAYEGKDGIYVAQASVDNETIDVKMDFSAANGKFNNAGNTDWAQVNNGTTFTIPSCKGATVSLETYDAITATTIDGVAAEGNTNKTYSTEIGSKAETIVIAVADGRYYRYIQVVLPVVETPAPTKKEKVIYSTEFSDWASAAVADSYTTDVTTTDKQDITFTLHQTKVDPTSFDESRFKEPSTKGYLIAEKNKQGTITTTAFNNITTLTFVHGATGGSRGWGLKVKGDGDSDWVTVSDAFASPSQGQKVEVEINRNNVQLQFYNLADNQNAYLMSLEIKGMVEVTGESYTIGIAAAPAEGGAVSIYPKADDYTEGDEVSLTATENFGYNFVNWTNAAGEEVSKDAKFKTTVTANETYTANFEQVDTYAINVAVEGGANDYMVTFDPAPTIVNGKNMYETGTKVTLTALSNPIITFNNWSTGDTSKEIEVTVDKDIDITATFSAVDYIVGWDFVKAGNNGRNADFYAADNDAVSLVMYKADGSTSGWLDKSLGTGGYEGRPGGVCWVVGTENGDVGNCYWQTKVNAEAFTDLKIQTAMVYNYNAYQKYDVQASLNGTDWETIGSINMQAVKSWTDLTANFPATYNNKKEVYVRWIADKTSKIDGTASKNDGACLGATYITGTAKLVDDGTAPVLVSSVPANGADNASANGKIVLTFDEKVKVADGANATLGDAQLTPAVSGKTVSFEYKGLQYSTAYTFTLPANSVSDLTDNAIAEAITINFQTKAKPAVEKGLYDVIVTNGEEMKAAIAQANGRTDKTKRFRIFVMPGSHTIPVYDTKVTVEVELANGTKEPRTYDEPRTYITSDNISIIGADYETTTITNSTPTETFTGRFGEANVSEGIGNNDVFQIQAKNTYFQGVTVKTGIGDARGRDIAVQDKGDKTIFKDARLWGYQDTYTNNNSNGRFYFEGGVVRGRTDYLCGKGDIWFEGVTLQQCGQGGYPIVPSQPKKYGWIFNGCTLTPETSDVTCTLGRPWGSGTPIALLINTTMEVVPGAEGWSEMSGGWPKRFAEYNSTTKTGTVIDLSQRKKTFGGKENCNNPILTAEEAAEYSIAKVMGDGDDWDPTAYTEQASAPTNVSLKEEALTWDDSNYVFCWAVIKNGVIVEFTTTPSYTVDDKTATWSVRAANEMGGLGEATIADTTLGINEAVSAQSRSAKYVTPTGIVIVKDGKKYTVTGAQMK